MGYGEEHPNTAIPGTTPRSVQSSRIRTTGILLIHESPLTDALFLLVSKSDEVTTT